MTPQPARRSRHGAATRQDPYTTGPAPNPPVWEAAYDRPVPARGHDPYAVTPSDPLDDWPPRKRPPFWHPGYATGTDWIVTVLSPGSGLLLLWARTTLDSGEEASAVFLFLLAAAFGLTALVQYLVRLFSKPFPPWLGMFVASAAGTALWVRYAVIPLLGSQRP